MKLALFYLTIVSYLLALSCKKEYSCEGCQGCKLDTTINIKDTAWRFNIGNKLYFGDFRWSMLMNNKHGFDFYGYSLHSPGAIFHLTLPNSAVSFDHEIYNLTVDSISINYGSNGTTAEKILGLNNVNNFEPRYMKGIIKTFDTSTNIVAGYFCGIALDDNSNPVQITNGRFTFKIN